MRNQLKVIGGGLAGSEAAWQAAQRGISVEIYEMRPTAETGAHTTDYLAELICSNSLGSNIPDRAAGLLKEELRRLGSLLIKCADRTAVPAGGALAVDRDKFAGMVTEAIESHPLIEVIREEVKEIPDGLVVIASGPLTSRRLSDSIINLSGEENLYFFDAIAPIVSIESVNFDIIFRGSRYGRGAQTEGDYLNCPLSEIQYQDFVKSLVSAERIKLNSVDRGVDSGVDAGPKEYFEGCLPIEVLARRDQKALAFGPLRPVGLIDPRTGNRPYAVVQLRQDNLAGTLYNLVGFQTNLKFSEQRRVFRMIPGLELVEFLRYGQMHRNTFIYSPGLLDPTLQFRTRPDLLFAGQITGVEGYAGNIATGLLAGINAARIIKGLLPVKAPRTTMLGSLTHYITNASPADYQPMKANFGILPPLEAKTKLNKRQRAAMYSERALGEITKFAASTNEMKVSSQL
jgi:methylenetetrahydrofolate--tRNA-(uracil-5-)-methyltransferase